MRRAAVAAVLCMGLGGCGAEDAAHDVADRVDPVAEAAEKTVAAGGARLTGSMRTRVEGQRGAIPLSMEGAASFADDRMSLTIDLADIPGAPERAVRKLRDDFELPYRSVQDGDVLYDSDGRIRELGVSEGISWVKLDLGEIDDEAGTALATFSRIGEFNPQEMLRFLQAAANARREGSDVIDGVHTTRWHADVRVADYPKALAPQERDAAEKTVRFLEQAMGKEPMPTTVWIDDEGLIRREHITWSTEQEGERVTVDARVDLLDIGAQVEVELPDDDAVKDVTDAVAERIGG